MTISEPKAFSSDESVMRYALEIAQRGEGSVEPNPMVGAVIVDRDLRLVAEGWHRKFGGPHAEIESLAGQKPLPEGAQLFVTLEPCSHHGKTPPCADAVAKAGFARVVIGCPDPAPHVAGRGIQKLRDCGIAVEVGVCEVEARNLIAPFRMLMLERRPWVHAKWAMTLDGKIASRTGHSQWISNAESRACVHRLRGRMDAILTAAGTVRSDNPRLTARPAGTRIPLRVVFDRTGESLTNDRHLVETAGEVPVLLAAENDRVDASHRQSLEKAGVEIFETHGESRADHVRCVLAELGRRQFTNVLLEAGSGLLGTCFEAGVIDEVHAFVAPKLVGGDKACSPIGGPGGDTIPSEDSLRDISITQFGTDVLIRGRTISRTSDR